MATHISPSHPFIDNLKAGKKLASRQLRKNASLILKTANLTEAREASERERVRDYVRGPLLSLRLRKDTRGSIIHDVGDEEVQRYPKSRQDYVITM